ncbi:hypothetical protein EON83_26520 [bacterium]|nr:MAG: hypothetical protein EON83_26520 [bacterium]
MKTIGRLTTAWKGLFALAAMLAFVPLTAGLSPAEAKPPRHAPAYGYRSKQYKRPVVRRAPRRTSWTTRVYRPTRRPSNSYRRPYTPSKRGYREPSRPSRNNWNNWNHRR